MRKKVIKIFFNHHVSLHNITCIFLEKIIFMTHHTRLLFYKTVSNLPTSSMVQIGAHILVWTLLYTRHYTHDFCTTLKIASSNARQQHCSTVWYGLIWVSAACRVCSFVCTTILFLFLESWVILNITHKKTQFVLVCGLYVFWSWAVWPLQLCFLMTVYLLAI